MPMYYILLNIKTAGTNFGKVFQNEMKRILITFISLLFFVNTFAQNTFITPTVISPAGGGGAMSNGWFIEYTVGESFVALPTDSFGIGFRHGIQFDTLTPKVDFWLTKKISLYKPNDFIAITANLENATIKSWIIKNGVIVGNKTSKNITLQYADTGSYDVALVFETPWGSTDTMMKRNFIQIVDLVPHDTIVCPKNQVVLQVLGPKMKSYMWNSGNNQSSSIANPVNSNSYTVLLTAQNGDTITLSSYIHVMQPVYLGKEIQKCNISAVIVDAGIHETYHWSTGSTTRTIDVLDVGIYSVTVSDAACISTDQVAVIQNKTENTIPFSVVGDSTVCEGSKESYRIVDTSHTPAKYHWTLHSTNNNAMTNDSLLQSYFAWNESGVDTIIVRRIEQNGCESENTKIIKVIPNPEVLFSATSISDEVYSFENKSVQPPLLVNGFMEPIPTTYTWKFLSEDIRDSLVSNDSLIHHRFPLGVNNIQLFSTNYYGCKTVSQQTIDVQLTSALSIPNAFESNSLKSSLALFQPKGCNLKEYSISIFDFWGNLIWYSDKLVDGSPAEGWDGKCNGIPLKVDSYIWKIEATFINGETWKGIQRKNGTYSKMGNVLLLR